MPPIDMLAKMHLKEGRVPDRPDGDSDTDKLAELESLFDLCHKADMRAIKQWQKATGRTRTWPDQTALCVWLLERLDEAEAALTPPAAFESILAGLLDAVAYARGSGDTDAEKIEVLTALVVDQTKRLDAAEARIQFLTPEDYR